MKWGEDLKRKKNIDMRDLQGTKYFILECFIIIQVIKNKMSQRKNVLNFNYFTLKISFNLIPFHFVHPNQSQHKTFHINRNNCSLNSKSSD